MGKVHVVVVGMVGHECRTIVENSILILEMRLWGREWQDITHRAQHLYLA